MRPQDRPHLGRRAAAARRRPARLRRAVRRHGGTPTAATIPIDRLLQPRVEAEIAFVLGADLADGPVDTAQVRSAVDYAVAALEIVDSRIADWDITLRRHRRRQRLLRRCSSSAPTPVPLDEFDPRRRRDAHDRRRRARCPPAPARACLGDPLDAVAWLARTARDLGDPLRAGEVVLSGALGPMVAGRRRDTRPRRPSPASGRVEPHSTCQRREAADARPRSPIIGSGNIGTDLMIKVLRAVAAPRDGRDGRHRPRLRRPRARRAGSACPTTAEGVDGLIAMPDFDEIEHRLRRHVGQGARGERRRARRRTARRLIDLTPAAIGPYVVPAVNLDDAPRRAERQHGDLRRPGHHPDRRRRVPGVAGAVRRDRRLDRVEVRRPRHPRQHRRVHRDHVGRHRSGRRRRARQGHHHPQPGRAAADHARHRVLPRRRARRAARTADPRSPSRRWSPTSPRTSPATGSSSRCSSPQIPDDQPVDTLHRRRP